MATKRGIFDTANRRWFKSNPVGWSVIDPSRVRFTLQQSKSAKYSMSDRDSQALEEVIHYLSQAFPSSTFEIVTYEK